ncbi:MAG: multicopper oxidase CueO [Hyphomicrobium sp.]|uniref:multicopper oxidase CueO n=1 Tax=Hyphomicrobium sp. TaxID=82 RepID=UPI0039E41C75
MNILSRRELLIGGSAFATIAGLRPLQTFAGDAARPSLPLPAELKADANGDIAFSATTGSISFAPGQMTPTYGYNGAFLGPALRLRRGKSVAIDFANNLDEPTTVHWHGLVIPGDVDGGPHQPVAPGTHWQPTLPIDQPAATLWFHPHFYPTTAAQVIKGLAGLIIVEDDDTDRLPLPSRWGVDDIPLIIQDRRFQSDGEFFDRMNIISVVNGYVGTVPLVNGVRYPEAKTARGWIRLRLLDGSNARSYLLKASDDRSLYVIGSDGGLLENPVEVKQLKMFAGERFEVLVDCRSGAPFDIVALPVGEAIMKLPPFDMPVPLVTIRPDGADGSGTLPDALAKLPPMPAELPPVSQELVMNMFRDEAGMMPLMKAGLMMGMGGGAMAMDHGSMADMPGMSHDTMPGMQGMSDAMPSAEVVARVTKLIEDSPELSMSEQLAANGVNGKPFAMGGGSGFVASRGETLHWKISEDTDKMLHPVHVHGCQFRIVSENGKPPEAYRAGWKDIAPIENAGTADILVSFPHKADAAAPYMAHCHILEHEDSGMMTHFTVA